MKAYFLSDLHLKDMQERNSQTLLRFLHSVRDEVRAVQSLGSDDNIADESTHDTETTSNSPVKLARAERDRRYVFLVGDIFDLWIGKHQYFVSKFEPIVDAVRELVEAGVEVHYFEGNHDLYLKQFWRKLGVITHEDHLLIEIDGVRVRIEHGDLMNPDDRGYLFLRWLLRTPILKLVAWLLPSKVVSWIGERASGVSRDYTSTRKFLPEENIRQIIRTHAIRAARDGSFDLLISGHVHVRDDYEFPMMKITEDDEAKDYVVRSVNLGSWFDEPSVFVLENRHGSFVSLEN